MIDVPMSRPTVGQSPLYGGFRHRETLGLHLVSALAQPLGLFLKIDLQKFFVHQALM